MFSLVDKDKNFIQLRNQIDRIDAQSKSEANVLKALKEAIKEFKEYSIGSDNHRYIICITNEMSEQSNNRIKKEDIKDLLKLFRANLIVLGIGMDM